MRYTPIEAVFLALWASLAVLAAAFPHAGFFPLCVVGGLPFVMRRIFWPRRARRTDLAMACAVPVAFRIFWLPMNLITAGTPKTVDSQLNAIDFGVSARLWHAAEANVWVNAAFAAIYASLPIAIMLGLFLAGPRQRQLVGAIVYGAILALPFYGAFPAVGPAHLKDPHAWRNCMPSMHLTWALLIAFNLRGKARTVAGLFAALTALATIATGEHYLPDLIAAVPLAVLVDWLAAQNGDRTTPAEEMKGRNAMLPETGSCQIALSNQVTDRTTHGIETGKLTDWRSP